VLISDVPYDYKDYDLVFLPSVLNEQYLYEKGTANLSLLATEFPFLMVILV
jgi:hypothetical protein